MDDYLFNIYINAVERKQLQEHYNAVGWITFTFICYAVERGTFIYIRYYSADRVAFIPVQYCWRKNTHQPGRVASAITKSDAYFLY